MDKDQLKEFTKQIMEELDLKGGRISKLIKQIAPKYDYDKKKIKIQVKRALVGSH
jgi:hypothetical protein